MQKFPKKPLGFDEENCFSPKILFLKKFRSKRKEKKKKRSKMHKQKHKHRERERERFEPVENTKEKEKP